MSSDDASIRTQHRRACIEAMEEAFYNRTSGEPTSIYEAMTAAFDAIATADSRVVPNGATEEMVAAGRAANLDKYSNEGLYQRIWRAMSAAGDLTNPPENKS